MKQKCQGLKTSMESQGFDVNNQFSIVFSWKMKGSLFVVFSKEIVCMIVV